MFPFFFFPQIRTEDPWFFMVLWAIEAILAAVAVVYATANVRARGTFACRIDAKTIFCMTPAPWCGDSFDLAIADIRKLEKEVWSESHRWFIWDKTGRRCWLTANYGNPADDFISVIKKLNPKVIEFTS